MDNFRGVLEYIRNFFTPTFLEPPRKRRAPDTLDHFLSPKCRRLQISVPRDSDDGWLVHRSPARRPPILKTSLRMPLRTNRQVDTVVLDDEDDVIEVRSPEDDRFTRTPKPQTKFTSTPDIQEKSYTNGISDDEEIKFIKEIKSTREKQMEASKRGLNYIKPFSGAQQNGTKPKDIPTLLSNISKKSNNSRPSFGSSSLDYSVRLDDKMQYKRLLDSVSANNSNNSSIYHTPVGRLFNYDTANRSAKMLAMARTSPAGSGANLNGSKDRMSTKDRIIKVLDDFENEPVVVKDSDSDSDVVFVNPPSPKPDIKVDPVNSLKKVVDCSQQTKTAWLDEILDRHRNFVARRQKEIDELKECSERHGKINKDLRWELLTNKVNRSLSIKEAILPEQEEEEEVELPVLTEAQLRQVDYAFRGDPNEVLARKFNLNITRRDLQTLAGLNWLNDEVINFYMNLIIERGKDSRWPKAYAFNTFFYLKLVNNGPQSLRRWTKRVDLFDHDLVCVPIHLGMHWCMAIVDFRDKSIRYYDSMGSSNNKCLEALRKYLEAEHMDKKKAAYDTSDFLLENVKDIPQQMNGSDCGMFACTFAEFRARNAKITFSQEHMPYLRKKMVVEILAGQLLVK